VRGGGDHTAVSAVNHFGAAKEITTVNLQNEHTLIADVIERPLPENARAQAGVVFWVRVLGRGSQPAVRLSEAGHIGFQAGDLPGMPEKIDGAIIFKEGSIDLVPESLRGLYVLVGAFRSAGGAP
jgi:hypothetical protein